MRSTFSVSVSPKGLLVGVVVGNTSKLFGDDQSGHQYQGINGNIILAYVNHIWYGNKLMNIGSIRSQAPKSVIVRIWRRFNA